MPASKDARAKRYSRMVSRRNARRADTPKRQPTDRENALAAAAAEKTRRLAELKRDYEPRIVDLEIEYAEKRREVWADYEERKQLIRQATILEPAGA